MPNNLPQHWENNYISKDDFIVDIQTSVLV